MQNMLKHMQNMGFKISYAEYALPTLPTSNQPTQFKPTYNQSQLTMLCQTRNDRIASDVLNLIISEQALRVGPVKTHTKAKNSNAPSLSKVIQSICFRAQMRSSTKSRGAT
jgi:hypothetical protein